MNPEDALILFESNTEEPTTFLYEGQPIVNFGWVQIAVDPSFSPPVEPAP